ncbi:glycosylated lysosomal membrane protein [Narcine bancroftii]|uniref:glycosylated lysosomal membrane protein n=1 Tax=Narcine bancroftii TaxID=1343680 RepID=UPI0038315FF7
MLHLVNENSRPNNSSSGSSFIFFASLYFAGTLGKFPFGGSAKGEELAAPLRARKSADETVAIMALDIVLAAFWLVTLSPALARPDSYRRQVTFEYNPGRDPPTASSTAPNLLHVRAVGCNDTIHYVWSSLGAPTVLLIYSRSASSTLRVNWTKLVLRDPTGAVRIEPPEAVVYSTAVVFSRLFEYDDVNCTADLMQVPADSFYPSYLLEDFTWEDVNATINTSTFTAQLRGRNATGRAFANGSIAFRIAAFEDSGCDGDLPHLLHTANSSKVEFVIENLQARGNQSRFGLELLVLEDEVTQQEMRVSRTIDDEYTPSIFKVAELVGVMRNSSQVRSFLQWKPVVYSSPRPSLVNSTQSRHYTLQTDPNQTLPATSIAFALAGTQWRQGSGVSALNISFGSPGDQLDLSHPYISWSALIGYGDPPEDTISVLVLVIMAVGLGLPALLLLLGGVVVSTIRRRRQTTGYQPIN